MTRLSDYASDEITRIREWKNEEPSVVAQTLSWITSPVSWLMSQVVPETAVEALLNGADWMTEWTIPISSGLGEDADLRARDDEAISVQNWAMSYAIAEGTAAGFVGILSEPLDIPAVIMLSLRTIRRVGLCYGYAGSSEDERQFVLGVLSSAGANTMKEKLAAIAMLSSLKRLLVTTTFNRMAERAAVRDVAIIALRDLAKQVGLNLTKRKALAAIPAIGALVGGSLNGWYMNDVGRAAQRAYQERWLRDHRLVSGDV